MSPRLIRWLPWAAGALLAAGVIAFMVAYFGNTASPKETFGTKPATKPQVVKQIPLVRAEREVAGKFILTAVARKHLDQAWKLATPNVKEGLTYKQWLTGEIGVPALGVPIAQAAITKIIYSHQNDAELNIVLIPKANHVGIKDTLMVVDLKKIGGRWLVDYCQVHASIPLPNPD